MPPLLILGLGNPDPQYDNTRHNVGFEALDFLRVCLEAPNFRIHRILFSSTTSVLCKTKKVILAKPTTFMNESGRAALALRSFYHLNLQDIIIVHDDIDLVFGTVKTSINRGAAGHKGVMSVIQAFGCKDFARIRIGIHPASADRKVKAENIVLKAFSKEEMQQIEQIFAQLLEAVMMILKTAREK